MAGSKDRSTGADGKDIIIDVPLGTIAKNAETGEILFEITKKPEVIAFPPDSHLSHSGS